MTNPPIIHKLTQLGLSEKSAEIYLAVLKRGKATVLQIFRDTRIQRPTIYEHVRVLEDMGLLTTTVHGVKKYLVAGDAERLYQLVEEKGKIAKDVMGDIALISRGETLRTPVKLYSGREGAKQLADLILHSKDKRVCTIGSYETLTKLFSFQYLHVLWEARNRRNIHVDVLFPHAELPMIAANKDYGEIGNIRYERDVRILPEAIEFHTMYTILDDHVLFWSSPEEDFFFSFDSKSHAASLKSIFEMLWGISTPIEKLVTKLLMKAESGMIGGTP